MTFRDFSTGRFYNGDCLDVMKEIPDSCIDMILCDLPYGTTQNKWDSVIPLDLLWAQYWRIAKPNAAIVLTAAMPFTAALVVSQLKNFKYQWVWDKVNKFSGHLNAKKQPMRITEDICIFYKEQSIYNPIMTIGKPYKATSKGAKSSNYGAQLDGVTTVNNGNYYPRNLISIPGDERGTVGRVHPTQKPVALFEYLIKTYSNEGMLILDNTAGSGTTAIAAINTNRKWVCIEQNPEYYSKACERIENHSLPTEATASLSSVEVPCPID